MHTVAQRTKIHLCHILLAQQPTVYPAKYLPTCQSDRPDRPFKLRLGAECAAMGEFYRSTTRVHALAPLVPYNLQAPKFPIS
jgi:hypothetical protein